MTMKRTLPVAIVAIAVIALIIAIVLRRPERAPAVPAASASLPVSKGSAPEPEDTGGADLESAQAPLTPEQRRAIFIRNVRVGDMRAWLGEDAPAYVARLFATDQMRPAAQILLRTGREGDPSGYAAIRRLLAVCPGPEGDRDFERRVADWRRAGDAAIDEARLKGTPEELLERVRWARDAAYANRYAVWATFCPGPQRQGEADEMLGEAESNVGAFFARRLRGQLRLHEHEQRAAEMRKLQTRAEASERTLGNEVARAREELASKSAQERVAAFEKLLLLAERSASAQVALAGCLQMQCVPNPGGADEVRALFIQAARAGSLEAMQALAGAYRIDPYSEHVPASPRTTTVERYAWYAVGQELLASGCYGLKHYYRWALLERDRKSPLMMLSPAEAQAAQQRAREMIKVEVPTILTEVGCNPGARQ